MYAKVEQMYIIDGRVQWTLGSPTPFAFPLLTPPPSPFLPDFPSKEQDDISSGRNSLP